MPNVETPVVMMDNDFHDPDLDNYLKLFNKYDPSIAVLGDSYNRRQAEKLDSIAENLLEEHPEKTVIVVPKTRESFHELSDDVVLGYPNGYSDLQASDYSEPSDWRGRDVHILGGNPKSQYSIIQELTQPTLAGHEPSNIIGVDWNGPQKVAYHGEYWNPKSWRNADHLSIRETVRKSLEEIKQFWQTKGLWPETTPRDIHGPVTVEPDEPVFLDDGGPIHSWEELESAYIGEYDELGTAAFRSEKRKQFVEHRENLLG